MYIYSTCNILIYYKSSGILLFLVLIIFIYYFFYLVLITIILILHLHIQEAELEKSRVDNERLSDQVRTKESERASLETELRQVKQQVEEQKEAIKNNENGESPQSRDLHVHVHVYDAFVLIPYSQNILTLQNQSSLKRQPYSISIIGCLVFI